MALPFVQNSAGDRGHFNFRQQDGTRTFTSVTVSPPIGAWPGEQVLMADWESAQVCEVISRTGGGTHPETYQLRRLSA
jgi:hypothetical protein